MKRLLALAIAVAFLAGMIGCSGGTTTAPRVPPKGTPEHTGSVTPIPTHKAETPIPTHKAAEPTHKAELPTHKETQKETSKETKKS